MSAFENKTHLKGLRVVRGPDWKWGDQDGGEGHAGTVIKIKTKSSGAVPILASSSAEINIHEAKMVTQITVLWDSGFKGKYRGGPKGSYDLRILDNSAVADGPHPNVFCDGIVNSCGKEIRGFRWQCATCSKNFCTSCFSRETPHDADHNLFKRYDDNKTTEPRTVSCWNAACGPDSRIRLMGIYPGAKVFPFSRARPVLKWNDKEDQEDECAMVTSQPLDESNGLIPFHWISKKGSGDESFKRGECWKAKDVSCGGRFSIDALPIFDCVSKLVHQDPKSELVPNDDSLKVNQMSKFSVNEIVQLKNDWLTIEEIAKNLGKTPADVAFKVQGLVGQVTGFDEEDPNRLYVKFNSVKIYEWQDMSKSLSSTWMDHLETEQTMLDRELVEITEKLSDLMFKAALEGELRVAKLLHSRYGIDVNVRNSGGMTVLHIACLHGHKEFVNWLINEVGAAVEKTNDQFDCRAIHYATYGAHYEILQMLIEKGVQLDSQDNGGITALRIATDERLTDCVRLLTQHGSDVTIQDCEGNTALHVAVHQWTTPPDIIKLLADSSRDLTLCNDEGLNVFHLAIARGNVKSIRLLLENNSKILLESKDRTGRTPFLIACCQKDYATIELLIEAGADLTAADNVGNDAVMLAATHLEKDEVPPKDFSSKMWKEIPFAPSLFLLGFLVDKGCSWNTANQAGTKTSDILLTKGFHQDEIKTLAEFSDKTQILARRVSDRMICMLRSDCVLPPAFQLSCPHRPSFRACTACFLVNLVTFEEAKCRCPDEKISSVPAASKGESLNTDESLEKDVKVKMRIGVDRKSAGKLDADEAKQ